MEKIPNTSYRNGMNAAVFCSFTDVDFIVQSLAPWFGKAGCYLMSPDDGLLPGFFSTQRLDFAGSLPDSPEAAREQVLGDLERHAASHEDMTCLIVDMRWSLNAIWGGAMIERWGAIVEQFVESHDVSVISLYDTEALIEDHLTSAFRVHCFFLSPSGQHKNPHWLPNAIIANGTTEEQLSFLLGQIVPEFTGKTFNKTQVPGLARGATPTWVRQSRHGVVRSPSSSRWNIRCLGQLQVYIDGNVEVDWAVPGSAPKKSKALFAYLLSHGDQWCHTDKLSEFLWPDSKSEAQKRARLRHTLAMLRKSLGGTDTIQRSSEFFRLNIPEGSWIDIQAFEQLCRRGLSLFRHKDYTGAIRVYEAAERLYSGELFQDLPPEYVQSKFDDWCIPRRVWLHDMAVKLQHDFSRLLRLNGQVREAFEHAQKAVQLDPLDQGAHIEAMRCLAAQGRLDAVKRQFQFYRKAVEEFADGEVEGEVEDVYKELSEQRV